MYSRSSQFCQYMNVSSINASLTPTPSHRTRGYLCSFPSTGTPPPPISGNGYYIPPISGIGYHWQLQKHPFSGISRKSSRDYGPKIPPFPEKMGIRMRHPHAFACSHILEQWIFGYRLSAQKVFAHYATDVIVNLFEEPLLPIKQIADTCHNRSFHRLV